MLRRVLPVFLLALSAAAAVGLAACDNASSDASPTVDDGGTTVRVGDGLAIRAELALTPAQRTLGLGQRDSLASGAGMLFVFQEPDEHTFCMCGMRFPLDFVWIGPDMRVVDLSRDVPPPDEANGEPASFRPSEPVLYVLEINAGLVDGAGVQVGDAVTFEPEVSPGQAS
ncbi:MAG: DUF192 domain-containing protein [Dehalococcoidia bacterium]